MLDRLKAPGFHALTRIFGRLMMVFGLSFAIVGVTADLAAAHDIGTPSAVCVDQTSAKFTFPFSNFGSEQRDVQIYLNGVLVGQFNDLSGDGDHIVTVTGLEPQTGVVYFTWTTDANVPGGTKPIAVDFGPCTGATTTGGTTTLPPKPTTEVVAGNGECVNKFNAHFVFNVSNLSNPPGSMRLEAPTGEFVEFTFTQNGPVNVFLTLSDVQVGIVLFTWTTTAVAPQGTPPIPVDFGPSTNIDGACGPIVTTTTSTTMATTTMATTTMATTTMATTTTGGSTTSTPTTGFPCGLCAGQGGSTTTVAPTTTVVPATTVATTTAPPPPSTEAPTTAASLSPTTTQTLPVTGPPYLGQEIAGGLAVALSGLVLEIFSRRRKGVTA